MGAGMHRHLCTEAALQAVRKNGGGALAEKIESQKVEIARQRDRADMAERQVRDLARENDRLKREIAALRTGGGR
jgi:hypothetical protein